MLWVIQNSVYTPGTARFSVSKLSNFPFLRIYNRTRNPDIPFLGKQNHAVSVHFRADSVSRIQKRTRDPEILSEICSWIPILPLMKIKNTLIVTNQNHMIQPCLHWMQDQQIWSVIISLRLFISALQCWTFPVSEEVCNPMSRQRYRSRHWAQFWSRELNATHTTQSQIYIWSLHNYHIKIVDPQRFAQLKINFQGQERVKNSEFEMFSARMSTQIWTGVIKSTKGNPYLNL